MEEMNSQQKQLTPINKSFCAVCFPGLGTKIVPKRTSYFTHHKIMTAAQLRAYTQP